MKSDKTPFYIGWQEDMPEPTRKFLRPIIIALMILLPLLAISVVYWQQPFNDHNFEFGQLTEISGTYHDLPYPTLVADKGILAEGLSTSILLVGYGKFGAEGIISDMEAAHGSSLNGKNVSLRGTLIYGDDRTLLELTEQADALVQVGEQTSTALRMQSLSPISVSGEVIDPKCYFGVMKPGEGKTHKSCAIRCISGGIPPVLKQEVAAGSYEYYLIQDAQGRPVNEKILSLVGEQVRLNGQTSEANGWKVLYIDIDNLPLFMMTEEQMCSGHLLTDNS
ncbi:MAG: hypothetical protein AAFP77_04145 [Bacteroidota bacterium]